MLTGYQVEVIAGYTEYGDILCLDCTLDSFTKPLSRYELDEEQTVRGSDYYYGEDGHVDEGCECCPSVDCASCGTTLVEEYSTTECGEELKDDE